MICNSCHRGIDSFVKFCPYCGMLIVRPREDAYKPQPETDIIAEDADQARDISEAVAFMLEPVDEPTIDLDKESKDLPEVEKEAGYVAPLQDYEAKGAEPDTKPAAFNAESEIPKRGSITVINANMAPKLGLGQFFLMELLAMIPLVGFIVMCIFAFSKKANPNRAALAQAKLLMMMAITLALLIAFIIILILLAKNIIYLPW